MVCAGCPRSCLRIGADEGNDEFVGDAFVVRLFHALHRIGYLPPSPSPLHHGVERFGNALPAAVAVHGIVAATDRRNLPGVVLAHLLLQLFEVAGAVGGQSIAAIHEGVHEDAINAIFFRHPQQRVEMRLIGMHAAVGEQTEQMQAAIAGARILHGGEQHGWEKNSPFWIISSMRVLSMCTMRPAPMLRWPTSLLPICPSGSPTYGPLV